jgi:2-polyprenyl-6-hydroxyphenyl methylase/3-demethylubiquinone-9 3-methyltransferase
MPLPGCIRVREVALFELRACGAGMLTLKRLTILAIADRAPLRAAFDLVVPYQRSGVAAPEVDAIYASGGPWATMRTLSDAGRYGEIVEWIRRLAPHGPVLDIGAGDGLLAQAMAGLPIPYVGVDFAAATMARMQAEHGGPLRRFVVGDATSYVPERRYPVILLNDMLYFLEEPIRHAKRLAGYLEPGGALIVAMYLGRYQLKVLHGLHKAFHVEEQSYVVSARGRSFVQLIARQR